MEDIKTGRPFQIFKIFLYIMPFLLGITGFVAVEKEPILDSIFFIVNMYVLNYGDKPANVFIELARWIAPLATASGIISLVYILRVRIHDSLIYHRGGSVAVFGSPDVKDELLKQLGKRGISIVSRFVPADCYILAADEADNLEFFHKHEAALLHHKVYVKSTFLQAQFSPSPDVTLFSEEEAAARNYWLKYPIFQKVREKGYLYQIVLIGYGKLGDELLLNALQTNIFDPRQHLVYHVFGAEDELKYLRSSMQALEDDVFFHEEMWYQDRKLLNEADLILVLEQDNQNQTLSNLLYMTTNQNICVFSSQSIESLIREREGVTFYDWHREGLKIDNIMNEANIENAKELNYRYVLEDRKSKNKNAAYDKAERDALWKELDAFTRYSNISAANYQAMRLHMIEVSGYAKDASSLTEAQLQLLAELEHIRWCRYHLLNNWHYGKPEHGRKDRLQRIHSDLIPYAELSEEEKKKDADNIRVLLNSRH